MLERQDKNDTYINHKKVCNEWSIVCANATHISLTKLQVDMYIN